MGDLLIIQCSMTKSKLPRGKASDIYTGQVFKLGLKFAETYNMRVLILSGKYGLIEPDTIIDNYDLKMPNYTGKWPAESARWLGGKKYFKNSPPHITPLIPNNRGYGDMKNWLGKHIHGKI